MVAASASVGREQNNILAILEVDGAPAARFLKQFSELLKNGELPRDEIGSAR